MDGDLHFVIADASSKAPISKGWLDVSAPLADVEAARADLSLLIGFVPYKSGLVCIDIDVGKGRPVGDWAEAVEESLGAPLCEVRTRSGGRHLFYRCDQPIGNRSWEGGKIRCDAGYAVLWNPGAVLAALEGLQDADPVDVTAWPISKPQAASRRQGRKPRRGVSAEQKQRGKSAESVGLHSVREVVLP